VGFSPVGGGKMVNDETGEEKELKEPPYSVPKGHTFHYEGQELLEFSIVNIPSNPNALKRDLRNQTANALHFLKRELGQDITYGEIERMKVLDVIKMLETGEKPEKKADATITIDSSEIVRTIDNKIEEFKEESQNESRGEGNFETNQRNITLIKTKEANYNGLNRKRTS